MNSSHNGKSPVNPLDDDYYDEDDDDDGKTPGPGAYWNPQQSTTFKVKSVPERLQFFGSTVERFNEAQRLKNSLQNLGPGAYSVSSTTATNKKMRNSNYIPFATSEPRFSE